MVIKNKLRIYIVMRVLAISPMHDSSVAVVNNGAVESYFKEERLSRVKRDPNPYLAFDQAVQNLQGPVDAVVFAPPVSHQAANGAFWNDIVRKKLRIDEMIDFGREHHLQHAWLARVNSGWDHCAVIVVDRVGSITADGSIEGETVFEFRGLEYIKTVSNTWRPGTNDITITRAYEAAGTAMGVGLLDGGKVMGLSAWAKDHPKKSLWNQKWAEDQFLIKNSDLMCPVEFINQQRHAAVTKQNYLPLAGLAQWVQQETQRAMASLVANCLDKGINRICITGGYGLNIVTNSWLTEKFPDVEFYFEPMADDSGNSIGAALYWHDTQQQKISDPLKNIFIHGTGIGYVPTGKSMTLPEVVSKIHQGASVGIVQGHAEAGPRALGNRSLLFSPLLPDARDIVNAIKKREWYRPFACVVLEDEAAVWFSDLKTDTYMTRSYTATQFAKKTIPGVIHVDGSCRVQTVTLTDGVLYDILKEFKALTGHGVLLNTSLNLAGEPLVETAEQAMHMVDNSDLDMVWFPDCLSYY